MSVPYKFPLREVKQLSELPSGTFYLIQFYEEQSVYHEGDERSKRFPGHGYPAYTEHYLSIRQFVTTSREAWTQALNDLYVAEPGRSNVAAFYVDRSQIKTTIQVELQTHR